MGIESTEPDYQFETKEPNIGAIWLQNEGG